MIEVIFKAADSNNWIIPSEQYGHQLVEVTGLNPPKANINTSALSGIDGAYFISSQINARNIVLTYKPIETLDYTIEGQRLRFINWFEQNRRIDLGFITENREAFISGYVESVEYNLFQNPQMIQISIICPEPNFHAENADVATIQFQSGPSGYAYAAVHDNSDCELGFILDLTASADIAKIIVVQSPKNYSATDEKFTITGIQNGDVIHVNTNNGQKSVTKNGVPYYSGFSGKFFKLPNKDYNPVVPISIGISIYCFNANDQRIGASGLFTGTMTVTQQYRGL